MKIASGTRLLVAVLSASLFASGFVAISVATDAEPAAATVSSNSAFDPGFIISDDVFYNSSAMTVTSIQGFIENHAPNCVTQKVGGATYTCLADYRETTPTRPADANCKSLPSKTKESAASIISRVAKACGINPQVLLVTLQKEQAFISGGARPSAIYRKAMGYGCADTSACVAKYYGFFKQLAGAAWQFKQYRAEPTHFGTVAGRNNAVRFNPSSSCGSSSVFIRNQATAGLYDYTPYQPNAAALDAGSGLGNRCSSYGNRNFWRYFTDWFGNPANLLPGGSFDGSSLSGWKDLDGNSNFALKRNDSRAQSGTGFAAAATAKVGRSIARSLPRAVRVGQAYAASIWVRAGTVGSTYSGTLVLSATGGTATESASQTFIANDTWQEVDVFLPIEKYSHSAVRVRVVESTPSSTLFIDSASVSTETPPPLRAPVALKSASFEKSVSGWTRGTGGAITLGLSKATTSHPAKTGSYFLSAETRHPDASLKQDAARKTAPGDSYTLTAWVRSSSPTKSIRGALAIAGIGGHNESTKQSFTAGPQWQQVSTTITMAKSKHTTLRSAIYVYTGHRALQVDDVRFTPNLLANPSFENGTDSSWFEDSGGAYTSSVGTPLTDATVTSVPDGIHFLQVTRSGTASTKIASDVVRPVRTGETYTVGGWFRSSDPSTPYVTQLRLIGRGGDGESEVATLPISVGSTWTYYEVSLKMTAPHTTVRTDIQVSSMPFALQVDGVQLH